MTKNSVKSMHIAVLCAAFLWSVLFASDAHALVIDNFTVTNISSVDAVATATVTEDVPDTVLVQWGDYPGGSNGGECYAFNIGGDDYACNISPLAAETNYYARATVSWSGGTEYSDEVNFTTGDSLITTGAVTEITSTDAMGHVTVEGGYFDSVGVAWGTSSGNYDQGFCVADNGVGAGNYSCLMDNLMDDVTYYVRAFGTLNNGEWMSADSHGDEVTFVAQGGGGGGEGYNLYAYVNDTENVTDQGATVNAMLGLDFGECDGSGEDPSECYWEYTREIEWRIDGGLYEEGGRCSTTNDGLGAYSCELTGLSANTVYYIRPRIGVPDGEGGYNMYYGMEWYLQTAAGSGGGGVGDNATQGIGNDITTDVQDVLSMTCNQTGNANDYIVEFGNLTPGTPVTGSTTCTVTTNSDAGYDLAVRRMDAESTMDKDTDAATNIADRTAWDAAGSGNATVWGVGDVNLGFTVYGSTATKNTTWWGTGTTQTDANNTYAGFPTVFQNIMQHTVYSEAATTTDIGYKLDVPTTQKSGTYAGEITYQVTTAP